MSKKKFTIPRLRELKEKGNVYIKHIPDFKNSKEIKFREILSLWVKDNPNEKPERWKWAFEPNILVLFVSPKGFHAWWNEYIDKFGDEINWIELLPKLEKCKLFWTADKGIRVFLKEDDSSRWCTIQEYIAMYGHDNVHTNFIDQDVPIVPMHKKFPQYLPTERPFFGSV